MLRKIVRIDEEKCNGCGECVAACVEGAIEIVDGKAKLVSDSYCDGLGACLGECPQDAITVEEREADPFDEEAVKEHVSRQSGTKPAHPHVCPGSAARAIQREQSPEAGDDAPAARSELANWPVQLSLVSPNAPYLQNADLLLTADCVPFAMGDFHARLLRGRPVVVGCPKLDEPDFYIQKLAQILTTSAIQSLTVVHMEVPCCFGLVHVAKQALAASGKDVPLREVAVTIQGAIAEEA